MYMYMYIWFWHILSVESFSMNDIKNVYKTADTQTLLTSCRTAWTCSSLLWSSCLDWSNSSWVSFSWSFSFCIISSFPESRRALKKDKTYILNTFYAFLSYQSKYNRLMGLTSHLRTCLLQPCGEAMEGN